MEVFLYNSTVCRLCGEENDNGTLLYSREENNEDLSEVINAYLPIKVSDDGQLPRTICPGCTIQLEATVEFLNLIINGQKVIREIHQREKEYKKSLINKPAEQQIITENIVYEVNTSTGVYKVEHPIALQVGGLDRPKRKRGRPPKKQKTPEELAQETSLKEQIDKTDIKDDKEEEINGKRRRKTPYRFKEVVQGKELERIFKEEGVTDAEDSDQDIKIVEDTAPKVPVSKEPEVIGHMENSGELVFVVKGKGRGRPKGRMRPTHEKCAICGKEFFSVGRYMSHVAQHGPVTYQCKACSQLFTTLINFKEHQTQTGHEGQNVLPSQKENEPKGKSSPNKDNEPKAEDPLDIRCKSSNNTITPEELPKLDHQPIGDVKDIKNEDDKLKSAKEEPSSDDNKPEKNGGVIQVTLSPEKSVDAIETNEKAPIKLKCPLCDKLFSSKQSRSMHLKATHNGERPYACAECGAKFAYPRSLALHAISHRKRRGAKGYACDLCGKVLNHPSSVVYHKQAEHAGTRFVCNTCGKCFRHKQLLRKHQLVHSQLRPFTCKTCNSTFKTKANLLNHQLLHSGVKKFSCELCKHKFAHKTSLTLHMRWHTGQKPYSCQICGKSFSQKGNLSEHERIHTGEKPFECEHCLRRFTTSSQHRLHLRRHSADKPYACPNCPKRFTTHGSWSAHVRREAGALPQRCGVCARAFADKWTLQKHARLHTGERPFRCPHCPRLFADSSNLNKHKKQVHKQVSLLASANQAHSQISQQGEVSAELVQQVLQQVVQTPKTVVKTVNSRIVPQVVANPIAISPKPVQKVEEQPEERVIYVTYDVDDEDSPAYHIMDPEEATNVEESRLVTTCALYSGESLLVPQQELVLQHQEEEEEILQEDPDDIPHHIVVETTPQHIPVTDEEGNPLQFTMQDGTKLAITSVDGKSLQVVTQDGQTIPIEINGFSEEDNSTKYIVSSLCM